MPQRPRSHQLESESEAAFTREIPSSWVYRPKPKDYGIDGEVEIFDENGAATGIIFYVQLKATDSQDERRNLSIRIPLDVGRYYASLDLPVLVVRYLSKSDEVYAKWFHSLDLYYGSRSSESVIFRFEKSDRWDESMAERVEGSARSYRNARLPAPPLPIEFSVQLLDEVTHGMERYELRAHLDRRLSSIQHLVRLKFVSYDGPVPSTGVVISNASVAIRIADAAVSTVHTERMISTEIARESFAADVFVTMALGFDWIGHSGIGADIILAMFPYSSLTANIQTAKGMARCLIRARQTKGAIQIAESLVSKGDAIDAATTYLLSFWMGAINESVDERIKLTYEILGIAKRLKSRGFKDQAAALFYSCANSFQYLGETKEAVRNYLVARRLNPAYERRAYFQAELASSYFREGNYKKAVTHYKAALKIKDDTDTQLRYADALMFSGRYLEARDKFKSAIENISRDRTKGQFISEWILKHHVLTCMSGTAVPDVQRRIADPFPAGFNPYQLTDAEIVVACEAALDKDALASLAWFNLGGVANRTGDAAYACEMFLTAAITNPDDLEAWTNAAATAWNAKKSHMVVLIVQAAFQRHGETFVLKMSELIPKDGRESFSTFVAEMTRELRVERKPIVRIHLSEDEAVVLGEDGATKVSNEAFSKTKERSS